MDHGMDVGKQGRSQPFAGTIPFDPIMTRPPHLNIDTEMVPPNWTLENDPRSKADARTEPDLNSKHRPTNPELLQGSIGSRNQ
ncbi:hypothetical protein NL676_025145 [Syzygium grande]|nr:hypothetical protein NL676_025145 [Syzygium grande]